MAKLRKDRDMAIRATREDTLKYQKALLGQIDLLVRENRVLRVDERDKLFRWLGKGLLGEDVNLPVPLPNADLEQIFEQQEYMNFETAADFMRNLAYVEEPPRGDRDMAHFWKASRRCALNCAAKALKSAAWHSAEQIPRSKQAVTKDWQD